MQTGKSRTGGAEQSCEKDAETAGDRVGGRTVAGIQVGVLV